MKLWICCIYYNVGKSFGISNADKTQIHCWSVDGHMVRDCVSRDWIVNCDFVCGRICCVMCGLWSNVSGGREKVKMRKPMKGPVRPKPSPDTLLLSKDVKCPRCQNFYVFGNALYRNKSNRTFFFFLHVLYLAFHKEWDALEFSIASIMVRFRDV